MSLQRASFRGDCSGEGFQEVLQRFKSVGCNLLVTGAVSDDVTAQATRTLLGARDADRKRIVALDGGRDADVGERLPVGVDANDPDVRLVDGQPRARSVPEPVRSAAGSPPDAERGTLGHLREEVVTAIDYYADDGLDPAALRLSVSSLDRLAAHHGPDAVARFVRAVTAMVRGARGLAHYHLPRPDDDALVERLSPLFEARIELRERDGRPTEQRWHVTECDRTTDWVRL